MASLTLIFTRSVELRKVPSDLIEDMCQRSHAHVFFYYRIRYKYENNWGVAGLQGLCLFLHGSVSRWEYTMKFKNSTLILCDDKPANGGFQSQKLVLQNCFHIMTLSWSTDVQRYWGKISAYYTWAEYFDKIHILDNLIYISINYLTFAIKLACYVNIYQHA